MGEGTSLGFHDSYLGEDGQNWERIETLGFLRFKLGQTRNTPRLVATRRSAVFVVVWTNSAAPFNPNEMGVLICNPVKI